MFNAMNNATTKAMNKAGRTEPRYHSRIGVVIAQEMRDIFLRWSPIVLFLLLVILISEPVFFPWTELASIKASMLNLCVFSVILGSSIGRDRTERTLEPLLATGIKRSEIIMGKFTAGAIVYVACILVQSTIGLLVANIPSVAAEHSYFTVIHPTVGLIISLMPFLILGGLGVIAVWLLLFTMYHKSTETGEKLSLKGYLYAVLMVVVIVAYFNNDGVKHYVWPFIAACPVFNFYQGLEVIFYQIGQSHHDSIFTHNNLIIRSNPYYLPVMYVTSPVVTVFCLMRATRNLEKGDSVG
jgi:hypothetical protein